MSIVLTSTEQPRPPVSDAIRNAVRDAFKIVPEGKTVAVVGIADLGNGSARLLVAWKSDNDHWKVGGQIGIAKGARRPDGYVAVEASW